MRLTEPLPAKTGDRFVVRFYSPLETIGGGVIIDPDPPKRKRHDRETLEAMKIRESGSAAERIYQAAVKSGGAAAVGELRAQLDMDEAEFSQELGSLLEEGRLVELLPGRVIADGNLDRLSGAGAELLRQYHLEHPLHAGLRIAELRQKLFGKTETAVANAVLGELAREGAFIVTGDKASLPGFEVRLTKRQQAIRERILDAFKNAGYETMAPEEIPGLFAPNEKSDSAQVVENLLSTGELVMLTPQIYWHRDTFIKALAIAEEHFRTNSDLTMPQFRDLLGTSRKYALAMLDYLDSAMATKKTGDVRTVFKGFDTLK
jgi:selenocysteine-specific elongation factor